MWIKHRAGRSAHLDPSMSSPSGYIGQAWWSRLQHPPAPHPLLFTAPWWTASLASTFKPAVMGRCQFIPLKGPADLEFNREPCFGQNKETEVLVTHIWASEFLGHPPLILSCIASFKKNKIKAVGILVALLGLCGPLPLPGEEHGRASRLVSGALGGTHVKASVPRRTSTSSWMLEGK